MTDDAENFLASLELKEPPSQMTAPLRAIWHGLRSEWDLAHEIVQAESDLESAWVHAWLHRIEGDLPDALLVWPREKEMPAGPTQEEGAAIAAALLCSA